MNGNTICSSCRHVASQLRTRDLLRQLPRAGFVSLAGAATTTPNDAPPPLPRQPPPSVKPAPPAPPAKKSPPRKPKSKAKKAQHEPHSDLLEELFLSGVNKSPSSLSTAPLKPQSASPDLYPHVEQLLELLNDPTAPISKIWRLFTTEICPRVLPKDAPTPYSLHFASKSLFRKLVTAHRKRTTADGEEGGVPPVSEIARYYACMNLMSSRASWIPMVDTFFTRETYDALSTSPDGHDIAEDILEAWRAILTHRAYVGRTPAECAESTATAWVLPHLNAVRVSRDMATEGVEKAFESLMSGNRQKPLQGMASRVLVTFAMLTHPRLQPPISMVEEHPFIKGIANVIVMSGMTPTQLMHYFKTLELPYMTALNIEWSSVISQAKRIAGLEVTNLPIRTKPIPAPTRHTPGSESPIFRSLARAISTKDLPSATRLWDEVSSWAAPPPQSTQSASPPSPKSPISRELGHQFIVAFTALHKPLAVSVWNALSSWGLPPTVATWHAMLEGLKSARDVKALHALWARMASLNIAPDVGCWTTYISALMYSGDLEGGVRAVVIMKNTWEDAAASYLLAQNLPRTPSSLKELGDIGSVVKPTTAVINAVTVALLRKNKIQVASRVLSMGGDLGLQPDSLTYNTILRSLVRKGDEAALKALLTQMDVQGVKGDIVTFTTTLERSLDNVEEMEPQEVTSLIDSLFQEMEHSGVRPNETTCSAIINAVLRRAPTMDFLAPAEYVVQKMETMGLKPTAHIQTMFIDFHFRQPVPDLDAIGLLVEKFTRQRLFRDHIFWDRVIEGYAGLWESDRALQAVRQCAKEGFKPGYVALELLVRALHRNGEVQMARELVGDVGMDRGGPIPEEVRGVDGQHGFWRAAENLGLIAHDLEARIEAKRGGEGR